METLLQWDGWLFTAVNGSQIGWLDGVAPWWREKTTWIPLYLALVTWVGYRFRWKALYWLLGLALSVGLADTLSSKVIKPTVARVRPCNDPSLQATVQLRIPCGGGFSFTSSHATNHFALATFWVLTLGSYLRWLPWLSWLWAGSIALAQVYVGVHYPLDVIVGAILGIAIGNIVAKTYLRFPNWRLHQPAQV